MARTCRLLSTVAGTAAVLLVLLLAHSPTGGARAGWASPATGAPVTHEVGPRLLRAVGASDSAGPPPGAVTARGPLHSALQRTGASD